MSWFSKIFKSKKEFNTEQRAARAAESILGNESLTSDLDDEAASLLLDWGLGLAKRVAHTTSHLGDDAAQEEMYPKLKAVRKLMRLANKWGANHQALDQPQRAEIFVDILKHVITIVEGKFISPSQEKITAFLDVKYENQAHLIRELGQFFDGEVIRD